MIFKLGFNILDEYHKRYRSPGSFLQTHKALHRRCLECVQLRVLHRQKFGLYRLNRLGMCLRTHSLAIQLRRSCLVKLLARWLCRRNFSLDQPLERRQSRKNHALTLCLATLPTLNNRLKYKPSRQYIRGRHSQLRSLLHHRRRLQSLLQNLRSPVCCRC